MKYLNNFCNKMPASQIALGCMRIGKMTPCQADEYINTALDCGYNYFDHADIYGGGNCETVFGETLKRNRGLRDKIYLQTKCSIRKNMYDFSKEHILSSVDNSLKRLGVEKIDVLLLHRPDILINPEEVASAFETLYQSGKVIAFGVSNHNPMQIELLKKYVKQKLIINQLQLSIAHAQMLSAGANVNLNNNDGLLRDGYVRDYCRLNDITIQPWSPLQHGFIKGTFIDNDKFVELNATLEQLANKYNVSKSALSIAWLLRLPEKMQPIIGSTNPDHLKQIAKATEITLSAQDWYAIYLAAGYCLP